MWGGYNQGAPPGATGGRYNPTTDSWLPVSTVGAPGESAFQAAVWTGEEMFISYGGATPEGLPALYNPSSDSWRRPTGAALRASSETEVALWTGKYILLDAARYELGNDKWWQGGNCGRGIARAWTGTDVLSVFSANSGTRERLMSVYEVP